MIFVTSDWHFGHDRGFIYCDRGFKSVEEMNESIVWWHNITVSNEDDVYVLGDLMLGNYEIGMDCIRRLKGKIHIVVGNHDTENRIELYRTLPNVVEIADVIRIKYNGYHFYLSHYPTLTANLEKESLKQCMINLYGHTHQKNDFYNDIPFMYHVGVDSHDCIPVSIDTIIEECNDKVEECKEMLW